MIYWGFLKTIDYVNRMLTCRTGEPENINSLDKLESVTATGYNIGNLSLFLLSIDVKENNYSLYSLPQPLQKITLSTFSILEIKSRVLPLFHNGGRPIEHT